MLKFGYILPKSNLEVFFTFGMRVRYPVKVKKTIRLKMSCVPLSEVIEILSIKSKTQRWMRWYRNGESHQFQQPVVKKYTFSKGPDNVDELEKLKEENHFK